MAAARWGSGRVAFLVHLAQVQAEVSAGWSLTAIYDKRKDELSGLQYRQFIRYVRRYITHGDGGTANADAAVRLPWRPAPKGMPSTDVGVRREREGGTNGNLAASPVDIDAFMGRTVDLDQYARIHKKRGLAP